jgi:membrane protein DedA with SNARE-associated domain
MNLEQLLTQYGYFAIFIGSMLEGETILTLAGFFIHQGYLSFIPTVVCAAAGGMLGDQLFFLLGRRYGQRILARFPSLTSHVDRVNQLIIKHNTGIIIGVRFMYGLRIAGPIALGMSHTPIRRFIIFNAIGAIVWAVLIVTIGYLFGQTVQWLFKDFQRYEKFGLIAVVVALVAFAVIRYWIKRRSSDGKE